MITTKSPRRGSLNTFVWAFLYCVLYLQVAPVAHAGKFQNFCKSLNCFSTEDVSRKVEPGRYDIDCPNPRAPKDSTGWTIYKTKSKPLPTVQDILTDLKLCGVANDPRVTNVFYSFNANPVTGGKIVNNVNKFIDAHPELNGKTINTVMPETWYTALWKKFPETRPMGSMAQKAWAARNSQALAMAASGEVYLVAREANIYTVPYVPKFEKGKEDLRWIGPHNVWYDHEFATLQNNPDVTAIYTVDAITQKIDKSPEASWVRNRTPPGDKAALNIDANTVTPQSLQKQKEEFERNNPRPDQCGEASTSNPNQKRAGGKPAAKGKANNSNKAKVPEKGTPSGSACTPKPKETSSNTGNTSGNVKPSATSTGKVSGTATKKATSLGAKPTTLATKASSSKAPAATAGKSIVNGSPNASKEPKTSPTPKTTKTSGKGKTSSNNKSSNKKCSGRKKTC